ncbi:MAG: glutathione S-transferase family protein [Alphaproteobacteria bacterium]|nr:MAG: glutathione S-transferase family protein [Alphaproteobacteria bacterium]
MQLIIGNRNYSSWSLRPWIAMKVLGIPFEEILIPFGTPLGNPAFRQRLAAYTPAGLVPVLIDGDVHVWETLAIMEYLAEKFPERGLWPAEKKARAEARAISSEMHAGFSALRSECPMNLRRPIRERALSEAARANVARVEEMWGDCRARYGGPFLFGAFSAADAMYAPMVARLNTYGVKVGAAARDYMETMMALPAWAERQAEALRETWIVPEDEADWPTVLTA